VLQESILGHPAWVVAYILVLAGLSIYGLHRYSMVWLFLKNRKKTPAPAARFENLPPVTIQLPVFNEFFVVERLLDAISRIDYPRELLEVQLLDDSTDESLPLAEGLVDKLRASGLDIRHIHRTNRIGFKAGALQEGLRTARGEIVFILDADFLPPPGILHRLVHYFTDPAVGMVQARWGHLNAGRSLLTQLQAMFLDGHLLIEQTARSHSGRFFNFNGTAGAWRRSCIDDAGGWEHDTLTEDLDLSYRAQLRGWKFVFLPDVVVPAELPEDIDGFKSQQHRWTKGSIQTCLKLLPAVWRSSIPLPLKFEATIHLTSNFCYLLLALLCALLFPQSHAASGGHWRTFLIDIPIFLATTVSIVIYYAVGQRHLHPRGWMKKMLLVPGLLSLAIGMSLNNAKAVAEAVLRRQSGFSRTPKTGSQGTAARRTAYRPERTLLPLAEALLAAFFAFCTWDAARSGSWTSVPFLLLFTGGFTYVAGLSLAARWTPARAAAIAALAAILLSGCATDNRHKLVISAADQRMVLLRDGQPVRTYPVSTSKFGLGDRAGSYATPTGLMRVKAKIGDGAPHGMVFKSRKPTGEILRPNAPGRDPIVTRILWLEGLEPGNRNAYPRHIYIHGTPEERNIGKPVSYGCVRMRSRDVAELFAEIGTGARVLVTPAPLAAALVEKPATARTGDAAF
jgi:cellulose synthase/poly-beta-1,6-N-acetylglucosamine synthase-like glycosyltransferase/lipoprotein-anchoring transpeptidase ErfK/SrfK